MIARAGIGFVPEDRQVFPEHSVEDNLVIGAKKGPSGQDYWNLARIYEMFPLLEPLRQRMAGRLSGGEQQMLTIARTLMGNPIGLLLDEPSEGLAPIIVERIGELLRQLRDMGATVLLAEQNMHFCLGIASHATVIDKGQIVYRDTDRRAESQRRDQSAVSGDLGRVLIKVANGDCDPIHVHFSALYELSGTPPEVPEVPVSDSGTAANLKQDLSRGPFRVLVCRVPF